MIYNLLHIETGRLRVVNMSEETLEKISLHGVLQQLCRSTAAEKCSSIKCNMCPYHFANYDILETPFKTSPYFDISLYQGDD